MGPGNRTHYWPIRCRWRISYHSCISIICKTSNENCHWHFISYYRYQFNFWISIQFKTNYARLEASFAFHRSRNYRNLFRQSFSRKNFQQDLEKNIWLVCVVNGYLYTYKRTILKTIGVDLSCVQLIPLYTKALKHEFY